MSRPVRIGIAVSVGVVVLGISAIWAADAGVSQDEQAIRALIQKIDAAWKTPGGSKLLAQVISERGYVFAMPKPGNPSLAAISGRAENVANFDKIATNAPGKHVHETRSIKIVGPLAYEEWKSVDELRDGTSRLLDWMSVYAKDESGWKLIFAAPTSLDKEQQIKVLTEKAVMALIHGRCAEALEASDGLIKLDPTDVKYEMGRGNALRGLGRNDEAMAAFDKAAASKNPAVQSDALRSKGEILAKQGKYDQAIVLFTKAIEVSDWVAPRYQRAAAEAMAGDTKAALVDLKKAIEMAPAGMTPAEIKGELTKNPAFEKLRDTEEFKNLMK